MMPGDPLVGGVTLRRPAIQSPDFSLAAQTGWAIMADGTAYFFDVDVVGTITVGTSPATQIELTDTGGVGQLLFLLNNALYGNGLLESAVSGGAAQIVLNGSQLLAQPDFVGDVWNSAAAGTSANREFIYNDDTGTAHEYAFMDASGFNIEAGLITAAEPGTGTPATPAAAESWHPASLINSWAASGNGVNGLWYRKVPFGPTGMLEIIADIQNNVTGNSTCFNLPAAYQPATSQNHPAAWNHPQASNSASLPWVFISSSTGAVQITGIEVANVPIFFHIFVPLETL
jgi:hypothetical protein